MCVCGNRTLTIWFWPRWWCSNGYFIPHPSSFILSSRRAWGGPLDRVDVTGGGNGFDRDRCQDHCVDVERRGKPGEVKRRVVGSPWRGGGSGGAFAVRLAGAAS